MQKERFILQQMQRNTKVYGICLKIFIAALAVFAAVLVATLFKGADIAVTAADLIIMAVIALQFPVFRKLHKDTAAACDEISRALADPDFSIPDGYSAATKSARNKTIREPKKIMTAIITFAFLAVLTGAIPPFFIWVGSLDDFATFNTGMLIVIIIFCVVTLFLIVLILMYIRDYRIARKLAAADSMQSSERSHT